MSDSPEEPVLITIDANSSVVPDAAGGLTQIFNCCKLKIIIISYSDIPHNLERDRKKILLYCILKKVSTVSSQSGCSFT